VPLWNRTQSPLHRGAPAIRSRTRPHRPTRETGGALCAEHAARYPARRKPASQLEEMPMTVPQLMPWIGGAQRFEAPLSALICPIDDSIASEIIESDAKVIDAAVKHGHTAFLKYRDTTVAKRVEWLLAAADAIDKIEVELVRSLIRFIG